MSHQRAAWFLTAAILAACGGGYKIRPITLEESATLQIAADPLVRQAGLRNCPMAVTLNDVQTRTLEVLPGPTAEFCLGFTVTSATLDLPPEELRALIAHGLAHLQLEHSALTSASSGSSRARARGYTQARTFSTEEEASADRQAARLLIAAAGTSGCTALARVLERAAAERERWSDWTDQHPVTPARSDTARRFCDRR